MKEKKGITFYVKGDIINGYVTQIGEETIEARNQTASKLVILIKQIDAVGLV